MYQVSYIAKDGTLHVKEYVRFGNARIALNKLIKAKVGNPKLVSVEGPELSAEDAARASEIGLIRKVSLLTGNEEYIPMPDCSLKRKVKEWDMIPFDCVMKIDAHVGEFDDRRDTVRMKLQNICSDSYVDKHGTKWVPLCASASDKRKGTFLAVREDLYQRVGKYLMLNIPTKYISMVVSKYLVYMGLQTSSTKPMCEVFGWEFDINRVAIIPDLESKTATPKEVLYVNSDNTIEERSNYKEPLNVFDGCGFYFGNGETFSCRPWGWTKCCVSPLGPKDKVIKWLKDQGWDGIIHQVDGTVKDVEDVSLILTESCWKGSKIFKTVAEWATACKELGYECCVCVRQHKAKKKDMPYQQGQLLRGSSAEALGLASHAIAEAQSWSKSAKACDLLSGVAGEAARIYPELLQTRYYNIALQEKYTKRRNAIIAGKVPAVGYSLFVMPHPVAFLLHMAQLPVMCPIKEDESVCSCVADGAEIVLTRNPDTDGCPVVKNIKRNPFCAEGVLYINPFSWIPILLRCDYDGDHVLAIVDDKIVSMFKLVYERWDKRPIVWDAPKGEKSAINKRTIHEALDASIAGTQTGIHSDNLTKLWNVSKKDLAKLVDKFGEDVVIKMIAIETMNVNVDIDSTKNASNKTKKAKEAEDMLKKLRELPLPEFCRFAKADMSRPADSEHWKSRCEYTGSVLDIYSKSVQKRLPETLEIKDLGDKVFQVSKIMIDPNRKMEGYIGLVGSPRSVGGELCNEGLFNNIAFRHAAEWKRILGGESKNYKEYQEILQKTALTEIKEFVEEQGGTVDGAYDVITRWLFLNTANVGDEAFKVLSKAYMTIFGEKMFSTIVINSGVVPPAYDEEEYGDEE